MAKKAVFISTESQNGIDRSIYVCLQDIARGRDGAIIFNVTLERGAAQASTIAV